MDSAKMLEMVRAAYSIVAGAGKGGMPSGHLYAMLMPVCDLAAYDSLIGLLTRTQILTKKGDLLIAAKV